MSGLIYAIGIGVTVFIIYTLVEFVWDRTPHGALSDAFTPSDAAAKPGGLRGMMSPLYRPVEKYAPPALLRKIYANLYWAQMGGKWLGWTPVQFVTLQVAAVTAAVVLGMGLYGDLGLTCIAALLAYNMPGILMNGVARRSRRNFMSQLPEFIQLVAAQMAANVSMEQAIRRVSKSPSIVGL